MKIKTSFITNSSSSTFIVVWPYKIKSKDDVAKFISKKYSHTVYHDVTTPILKNDADALQRIFEEIKNGTLDNFDYNEVLDEVCKRENITMNDLYNNRMWYIQSLKEVDIKQNKLSYKKAKKFLEEVPDESYIYIFRYADDDGEYFSEMEHGNIFAELQHIRISNH